jgi:hypothetical protein
MRFTVILLATLASSASFGQLLSYDFAADHQGWRRANLNPTTNELSVLGAATWNAGGFIDGDDFSTWAFHLSPELTGNYSSATRLEFDYSSLAGDAVYPLVILRNQGSAIFQSLQVPADNAWHRYGYDLTPGTWMFANGGAPTVATSGQIASVLGGLHQIGVSADNSVGIEYTRLDNLTLVPEPASLLFLGLGSVLLRRRKAA